MMSKTCRISLLKMGENTGNIHKYTHNYAEIALEEACFAGDTPFLSGSVKEFSQKGLQGLA